ncbi:FAD-dependent oxidoreductase [Cobetia marina]|jgi:rubredoxin-NAD+ reductase|uniref:NAD(P)/FAD-dependent oxidoreductase n=1 Tax=Cobetia TaxID=204286 RepID=UPI0024495F41|nr:MULTISPECIES: FAD-dependent oxidoreductase [Cobetia]MDH2291657.1 FAD-dependent oxidoreductase [Cobetia sp. 10Alg 146]MDO6787350.1 FAD-dependent oxidoreductase [Cobetia marina]
MRDPRTLVIIGTGMAGIGLARALRSRDKDSRLILVSQDSGHDYAKPLLSTAFAKGMSARALARQTSVALVDELDAELRTHQRVTSIDTHARQVWLGEECLAYDELVLALGAAPRRPFPIDDSVGSRVMSINDLDDYAAFSATLTAAREAGESGRVVIVGAGLVGCEYANDLKAAGHEVTLVAAEDTPLDGLLPQALGQRLGKAFDAIGVRRLQGEMVETITAGKATQAPVSVVLQSGHAVEGSLVLLATGLAPRIKLAQGAGLSAGGDGIRVDRHLATSRPHVWALGDCASVEGVNAMYVQPLQAAARVLAANLCGEAVELDWKAWPVLVKTPALPIVAYPPRTAVARWDITGEGDDLDARALDANERLIGYALTGASVRRKVELARQAPPLLG